MAHRAHKHFLLEQINCKLKNGIKIKRVNKPRRNVKKIRINTYLNDGHAQTSSC